MKIQKREDHTLAIRDSPANEWIAAQRVIFFFFLGYLLVPTLFIWKQACSVPTNRYTLNLKFYAGAPWNRGS